MRLWGFTKNTSDIWRRELIFQLSLMTNGTRNDRPVVISPGSRGGELRRWIVQTRDNSEELLAPWSWETHSELWEHISEYSQYMVMKWGQGELGRGKSINNHYLCWTCFHVVTWQPDRARCQSECEKWKHRTSGGYLNLWFVPSKNLTLVCVSGPAGGSHWRGDSFDMTGRNTNTSQWFCSEQKSTWKC